MSTLSTHVLDTARGRPGAGPRHFIFHPRLPFVYLLNELDASVDVLSFDAGRGLLATVQTLSALPSGARVDKPWAADLHLRPDGRFLYASERRSSTLAAFAVDAASGRLSPLGSTPTETEPRGFAISGDADGARNPMTRKPGYNLFQVYGRMAAERNHFNINLGDTIYSDSEISGLPPALTVLAILAFGGLFGFAGIVLATPLLLVAIILIKRIYVEDVLGDRQGD